MTVTARELGLAPCHACGRVSKLDADAHDAHCQRCGAPLHFRKPDSLARSWALLAAAAALYFPANLLPIMYTSQLFKNREDTIMSGVIALWQAGSWDLSLIVFIASMVVPALKIIVLAVLLFTTQRGSDWRLPERARLYRMIENIGHWSMLDIFVVVLLVSLVQLKFYGEVQAGAGAVAFGLVVILTMLASMSFDPRLMWDSQTRHNSGS